MSDVELRLTANVDNATREVGKFRKEYADLVRQVEKPLRQVNAFRDLESSLESTQQQMRQARERVRELGAALAGVANPSREMQAGYKLAVDELRKLERAEVALTGQLARRREELNAAGISTRNLAAEQARLAGELQRALQSGRADQAMQDARKALGVGAIQEAQQQLVSLREQYRLLSRDGSLSGKERAEAEATYRRSVSETLQRLRDLRTATREGASAATSAATTTQQRYEAARVTLARLAADQRTAAITARQLAIATASSDLGVTRYRQLQNEVARVRSQYDLLRRSGNLTTRELSLAQRNMTMRVRETQQALRQLNGEKARASTLLGGMAGRLGLVAAGYAAIRAVRGISSVSDDWAEMKDRIRLATTSQAEFETGMQRLREISDRTYTSMSNNAELFIRSMAPLREKGFSNNETLKFVEVLGLGLVASAAKGEQAEAVINQLGNALQQGVLRGDAFNAMIQKTPALADALARGLGVSREELARLAKEGELTTGTWVPALIGELESVGEAVDGMAVTVGDAMTRLKNAWNAAVGETDTQSLIEALDAIKQRIEDPVMSRAISSVGGFLVDIAAGVVGSGADMAGALDAAAASLAGFTGQLSELDRIENEIRAIKLTLDDNRSFGDLLPRLFFSKDDLQAQLEVLEERRELQKAALLGMRVDEMEAAEEAQKEREKADEEALASRRAFLEELSKIKETELEQVKKYLTEQVKEERKAQAELEKIGKKRLEIEKFYADAVSKLRSGGEAKPSYARAQDLQVEAQQLLRKGDFDGARDAAREAVKVLQELAEAGENTYGFEGFINALERIELSANDLEKTQAEEKLAGIQANLKSLQEQADELKDVELTVSLDEQAVEAVKQQLIKLAAEMKRELTLPVAPTVGSGSGSVPGFSGGGWTGPGGKYEPAGIVHRGEFVQPQSVMRQAGAREFMELFRRHGMRLFRGYADGGMVMPRALPRIPAIPPGLLQGAAAAPAGTPINLTIDGRSFGLQGMPDVAAELARFVRLQKLQAGKR